jgi:carbon storage regulator
MLVLKRRVGERLFIGDDIVVAVTEVRGSSYVRLGVTAPAGVRVDREEVRRRIEREGGPA